MVEYYNDEWNKMSEKINNILTKKQALHIIDSLYLHCEEKESLSRDFEDLRKYLKTKL